MARSFVTKIEISKADKAVAELRKVYDAFKVVSGEASKLENAMKALSQSLGALKGDSVRKFGTASANAAPKIEKLTQSLWNLSHVLANLGNHMGTAQQIMQLLNMAGFGGGGNKGGGGGGGKSGGGGTKQPPGLKQRAMNVLRKSRFSMSTGSFYPLVSSVMDLLGPELAPIAGIAMAGFEGAKAMDVYQQQYMGAVMSGASGRGAASMVNKTAYFGDSVMSSMGSVNGSMMNNPYLLMLGMQHGISPNYQGAFGDIDNARRLDKLIKVLGDVTQTSDNVAARATYGDSNLQDLVGRMRATQWTSKQMSNLQSLGDNGVVNKDNIKNSSRALATLAALWNQIKGLFSNLALTLAPFVAALALAATVVLKLVNVIWGFLNKFIFNPLTSFLTGGTSDGSNPVDANTDAINRNTTQLKKMTGSTQFFGAGASAAGGAIPGAIGASTLNSSRMRQHIMQGGLA